VIVEPPEVPDHLVGAAVQRAWGLVATTVERVDAGGDAWHWVVGDDGGPQWFATLDVAETPDDVRSRVAAYDAASRLAQRLPFVVGPVPTREEGVAVVPARGLLLTVAPYVEGTPVTLAGASEDRDRSVLAAMVAELQAQPVPPGLSRWRPRVGRVADAQREDLERCLAQEAWSGGPWAGPAARLVHEARPALVAALRRLSLLGAAVDGSAERWVVTHGETHAGRLLRTADGHRLVGWSSAAVAPRERDLVDALASAATDDPWYAYVEAGGRVEPLSSDSVQLFELQRRLARVAQHAVRLWRPHEDTADERRCFGLLEEELAALVDDRS
jgi:spectinomycin phosphotransferase